MENATNKKILYIEDQEGLRDALSTLLRNTGYEVYTASDGELGLKIIEEKSPDLVVLDLILPKKDGFEVMEALRSKEKTKNLPVIILTNLEEKYNIERVMSFGVRAYLVKATYSLTEVADKIKEILNT
jgi:DNA-binding response OmpR family regulator